MNPSCRVLLAVLISIELSFTSSIFVNLITIAVGLLYFLSKRPKLLSFLRIIFIPLIPAVGLFVTIYYFTPGRNLHFATVLFTRVYMYTIVGTSLLSLKELPELIASLEQVWHLPAKFAYGTLAAANLIPKVLYQIKTIRAAGQMRNYPLHVWSPTLYFKAILSAIQWSDNLAQAMISHGFKEDRPRTHFKVIKLKPIDYGVLLGGLALLQILIIISPF